MKKNEQKFYSTGTIFLLVGILAYFPYSILIAFLRNFIEIPSFFTGFYTALAFGLLAVKLVQFQIIKIPELVLNENGIKVRNAFLGYKFLEWKDIEKIRTYNFKITVYVKDNTKLLYKTESSKELEMLKEENIFIDKSFWDINFRNLLDENERNSSEPISEIISEKLQILFSEYLEKYGKNNLNFGIE